MNVGAVGTAIVYAKFIFLPRGGQAGGSKPGFWPAVLLLLGGLIAANAFDVQAYTLENMLKAIAIIGVGWLAYFLIFQRTAIKLPRMLEQFDHLVGFMSLISLLLFWMALLNMIGQLILRLTIWFLLTADFSLANIAIGIIIAALLPRSYAPPEPLREWLGVLGKIFMAIPIAYMEAFELIFRPHRSRRCDHGKSAKAIDRPC
jgi:hypothetical protein